MTALVPERRIVIRGVFKWSGLALGLVMLVAWGISVRWRIFGVLTNGLFVLGDGAISFDWTPQTGNTGWVIQSANGSYGLEWPTLMDTGAGLFLSLPFWIPVAITGLISVFLWLTERRTIVATHCGNCCYDLCTNVSGVCPECGTPISVEQKRAIVRAMNT